MRLTKKMRFLNFLKQFSKKNEEVKELTLLEVKEYINSWSKTMFTNTTLKLAEIKMLIDKEKNNAYENSQKLLKAEVNPNTPERAKQIMKGNREIYVKRIERFLETIVLSENFNKLLEFCNSFDTLLNDFGKNTIRNHQILNEFFILELRNVDDNIKELIKLIKKAKETIEESKILKADELKKNLEKIQQKINFKKELKEKIKLTKEKNEEENKIIKNEETNLKDLEEGKSHKQFINLINKKKLVIKELENLEKEILQNFSVIVRALKKYERITLEQKLVRSYLKNPLQILLLDKELKIVKLLAKMNNLIVDGRIELKDKKKNKILQKLTKLDRTYFKNFTRKHKKLTTEINIHSLEQEKMTIIKKVEEQEKSIKQKKDKLNSTKNDIENLTLELEKINIEKLKNNLTKEIKQVINIEIIVKK